MKNQVVLLIEDNRSIATVQSHIIQRAGFAVMHAESLAQAIELVEDNEFFCAVVDYNLPDAPNGEAILFILGAQVPAIVMTSKMDLQTREMLLKRAIVDYIPKENRQSYEYLQDLLQRLGSNEQRVILVVDDSASSRMIISSLLKRHKYTVLEAKDGVEALAEIRNHPNIRMVITDNEMPNMNGIELTNQIRQMYSKEEMVVIGVSAADNNTLSARFIKSGANDYLQKPFYPEEFYCRIMQNMQVLDYIDTIRQQANSDYLTDLPNRRYFFNKADKFFSGKEKMAYLAMMDIDFFKKINDQYGHDGGDDVLKVMANTLRQHFSGELMARFGGEEFCILFSQNQADCEQRLEAFRIAVSRLKVNSQGQDIQFTVSIGLNAQVCDNPTALLKEADENLYKAKQSGRNQLISSTNP